MYNFCKDFRIEVDGAPMWGVLFCHRTAGADGAPAFLIGGVQDGRYYEIQADPDRVRFHRHVM